MDHGHRGLPPTLLLRRCLLVLTVLLTPAAAHNHGLSHRAAGDHTHTSSGGSNDGSSPSATTTSKTQQQQRLWVFGDSYADTGNLGDLGRELTHAWYDPYGATFPGRPTGRFSDGRVLTDFVASAMGMPTPVAYKLRRGAARGLLARGMNFAVGGAGVLDTGNFQRNISAQIDLFQAQQQHPAAGVALVVVSGNDYSYAADKDNSTSAAIAYIPLGCTPLFTRALNYSGCDPVANAGAAQHNAALQSVLSALDPANRTFLLLDLNAPFAAFAEAAATASRFSEPRRPCCEAFLSTGGYCGQQDYDGRGQYALCDDPSKHFYWDNVHPTQAAWAAVAETFRPKIREFLST